MCLTFSITAFTGMLVYGITMIIGMATVIHVRKNGIDKGISVEDIAKNVRIIKTIFILLCLCILGATIRQMYLIQQQCS